MKMRAEIQGMRAIAVGFVLLYHLSDDQWPCGEQRALQKVGLRLKKSAFLGYLGVDV